MKIIIVCIALLFSFESHSQTNITSEDLKVLIGEWEGSLTYLDYQSGKPYTMPANLIVTQGKDANRLVLKNIYPNEPKANGTDKIRVTDDGRQINKHVVTSREILEDGRVQIQTEHKSKDDNKSAIVRYTYVIGNDFFLIRKDVQFEKSGAWIKRSEFKYHKG